LLNRPFVPKIRRVAVLAVGLSSAFWAIFTTPAHAQSEPWTRQVAVEEVASDGGPLGIFGLAVEVDVQRWLSISAGVGADLFAQEKYYTCPCPGGRNHLALMPRLRLPLLDGATFVALGLGISRSSDSSNVLRQDDELALEHRFQNGVRARAFAGIGFQITGPPDVLASFYAGAGLGYAVVPNPEHSSASPLPWYGWQPAIADTIAAVLIAHNRQYPHAFPAAFAIYGLTPPIIHIAHHHTGRAVASVVLRATLPFLSYLAPAGGGVAGDSADKGVAAVGAVLAALIDDVALAWDY